MLPYARKVSDENDVKVLLDLRDELVFDARNLQSDAVTKRSWYVIPIPAYIGSFRYSVLGEIEKISRYMQENALAYGYFIALKEDVVFEISNTMNSFAYCLGAQKMPTNALFLPTNHSFVLLFTETYIALASSLTLIQDIFGLSTQVMLYELPLIFEDDEYHALHLLVANTTVNLQIDNSSLHSEDILDVSIEKVSSTEEKHFVDSLLHKFMTDDMGIRPQWLIDKAFYVVVVPNQMGDVEADRLARAIHNINLDICYATNTNTLGDRKFRFRIAPSRLTLRSAQRDIDYSIWEYAIFPPDLSFLIIRSDNFWLIAGEKEFIEDALTYTLNAAYEMFVQYALFLFKKSPKSANQYVKLLDAYRLFMSD